MIQLIKLPRQRLFVIIIMNYVLSVSIGHIDTMENYREGLTNGQWVAKVENDIKS